MDNKLVIQVRDPLENALVGFPFEDDQYIDEETEDESGDGTWWITIELAHKTDTTAAQEMVLNSNPNVLYYAIK